jgi:peptidoglycan/xylan/chitin deacetylase (PgdA/CDA1 family)
MSKLSKMVQDKGFYYFDWNVTSGDAAGTPISSDQVYKNVIKSLREDYSVVLQHDIKGFSVNAVEKIIQYGLNNGYTFERLTETSPGAHHGINN